MQLYANVNVFGDSVEVEISDNLFDMQTQHGLSVAKMHEGQLRGTLLLAVTDITNFKVGVIVHDHMNIFEGRGVRIINNACLDNDEGTFNVA